VFLLWDAEWLFGGDADGDDVCVGEWIGLCCLYARERGKGNFGGRRGRSAASTGDSDDGRRREELEACLPVWGNVGGGESRRDVREVVEFGVPAAE